VYDLLCALINFQNTAIGDTLSSIIGGRYMFFSVFKEYRFIGVFFYEVTTKHFYSSRMFAVLNYCIFSHKTRVNAVYNSYLTRGNFKYFYNTKNRGALYYMLNLLGERGYINDIINFFRNASVLILAIYFVPITYVEAALWEFWLSRFFDLSLLNYHEYVGGPRLGHSMFHFMYASESLVSVGIFFKALFCTIPHLLLIVRACQLEWLFDFCYAGGFVY